MTYYNCHFGIVSVSDGKCRPQDLRLQLTSETLILQREEFSFPEENDEFYLNDELRIVELTRSNNNSLGISIKGGIDHNLPILISRVTQNENESHLYIGDAIIKVNDILLTSVPHDEAIEILKNAGLKVTLTVKHYKSAALFLLKNVRQRILKSPCLESPLLESTWKGIPKVVQTWVTVIEVPLLFAYITRYIYGTDKLRPNAFEVRGINGSNTGVIHTSDLTSLSHWIKLITDYISAQLSVQKSILNRSFAIPDQISYMGWIAEGVLNSNQPWQNWKPQFFVLKGSEVCVFDTPPVGTTWPSRYSGYKIYKAMFRIIKESENVDERQHCFLIQEKNTRYFSVETRQDLLRLEGAWHRTLCLTVSVLDSTSYHVVYKDFPAALTLDWKTGISLQSFLFSSSSRHYIFNYNISQLKGSSDDGEATLTLKFQENNDIVEHEFICLKLQELLFFLHSFLTAQIASSDPIFCSKIVI